MKNWQKMLAAAIACGAAFSASYVPAEAAYQINEEVKAPTKALKQAS